MRTTLKRRNGRTLTNGHPLIHDNFISTDAALPTHSPWMRNQWINKLRTAYQQASDGFTLWIIRHIRNWENQTSVTRRRRQVLFVFGGIGLGWVIRLIFLFQQPPTVSSLKPDVDRLSRLTSQSRAADSTHKADYLEARRAITQSGRSAGAVTR